MDDEEIADAVQEIQDDAQQEQHETHEEQHATNEEVHHVEQQALEVIGQTKEELWNQMLHQRLDHLEEKQDTTLATVSGLQSLILERFPSSESNLEEHKSHSPIGLTKPLAELEEESKAITATPITVGNQSDVAGQEEAKTEQQRRRSRSRRMFGVRR